MKSCKTEEFLSYVAHELATPVTVLRGFAEILQTPASLSQEQIGKIGNSLVSSCNRLEALIEALRLLAFTEHLSLKHFGEVPLRRLFLQIKEEFSRRHPQATLELVGEEMKVSLHPELFCLAMHNLLENGVKYSPSPAKMQITWLQDKGDLVIFVKDQGIGIAKEHLPFIFDRFYAVEKAGSFCKSLGLGLSIVKKIFSLHGMTIEVASELGKGSCFTIRKQISCQ